MKDIETQAKAMLLRARQQADQLLAAAQTEGESLKKAAQVEGFADGRKEGLAKGREEGLKAGREQALNEQRTQLTNLANALTGAMNQINASRRELEAAAVKDVLKLAIAIAERVTKRQGVLDPSVAIANVQEAMKLVLHSSDLRIAIHPTQKAALVDALPRLKLQWPVLEHVELLEDPKLVPGGCRIFTVHGQVDADLGTQLSRIVGDLLPEPELTA